MDKMPIIRAGKDLNPLPPRVEPGDKKLDREKLKKACTEFEALFISQMLKSIRQTIPKTGFFGNGLGNDVYQGLMDQELSQKLSQSKGLGLGKVIYRQMLKREEKISTAWAGGQPLKPLTQSRSEIEENR